MEFLQEYDLDIAVDDSVEESIVNLMNLCKPRWDKSDIRMERIQMGISNTLYKVYTESDVTTEDAVIVRIHGKPIEQFINRAEGEWVTRVMAASGQGGGILGKFNNGLIHQYLPGEPLTPKQTKEPQLLRLVAEQIAKIHSIDPNSYMNINDVGATYLEPAPTMAKRFYKLTTHLPEDLSQIGHKISPAFSTKSEMMKEVKFVENILEKLDCELVFNHGDTNPGNMIYNPTSGKLTLIDFELAAYDYYLHDVIMFILTAGMEFIDSEFSYDRIMTRGEELEFIRMYLEERNKLSSSPQKITSDRLEEAYEHCFIAGMLTLLTFAAWDYVLGDITVHDMSMIWLGNTGVAEYFKRKEKLRTEEWKYVNI